MRVTPRALMGVGWRLTGPGLATLEYKRSVKPGHIATGIERMTY
jgi:hypothetical protein